MQCFLNIHEERDKKNNNKVEGRRLETNWMPIEINLISGSLKNLFPSLLFHCTIRMVCQKTYKKLKDSVFYFFSLDPLYALSASNEKRFKKNDDEASSSSDGLRKISTFIFVRCVYIFLSNCNTRCNKRKRKTREEGYNIS